MNSLIPDAPVNQVRTTDTYVLRRYNIIGTDLVCIAVYAPVPSYFGHGHSVVSTFDETEIPAEFPAHWKPSATGDGTRYAVFGEVTDPATVAQAISAAFPGWKKENVIPGIGHQAKIENWQQCSPEYRAIAGKQFCPACGDTRTNNGETCAKCRQMNAQPATL